MSNYFFRQEKTSEKTNWSTPSFVRAPRTEGTQVIVELKGGWYQIGKGGGKASQRRGTMSYSTLHHNNHSASMSG